MAAAEPGSIDNSYIWEIYLVLKRFICTLVFTVKVMSMASEVEVYKTVGGLELTCEIDMPEGRGPFPVVLYVHSWSGNSRQLRAYSLHMASKNVAGVRINYRKMSDGNPFADAKQDVCDAIEYIRNNADQLCFDMNRFGVAGASAGALLTSLVVQSTPKCSCYIAFNGGFDLLRRSKSSFPDELAMKTMFPKMDEDVLRAASAIYHLRVVPPDTLLLHGTADSTINCGQSKRFADAIIQQGGQARVVLYEGEEHGFFNSSRPCYPKVLAEVEQHILRVFDLSP